MAKYEFAFTFDRAIHNYKARVEAKSKREALTLALVRGLSLYHSEDLVRVECFPEGTFEFPGDKP